jgi:hypothetical protein
MELWPATTTSTTDTQRALANVVTDLVGDPLTIVEVEVPPTRGRMPAIIMHSAAAPFKTCQE